MFERCTDAPNLGRLVPQVPIALLAAIGLLGCGARTDIPSVNLNTPEKPRTQLVDHPEFVNWYQFPEGTLITRKKEVTNENGKVLVMTTLRLAAKKTDRVVVESEVTVERPGHPLQENPPMTIELPARFQLPQRMQI